MKREIITPLIVITLFHENWIFVQNPGELFMRCPVLARVLNSRRCRNRAAALAPVHEQPFALSHCVTGDLLGVLSTQ
jgi:hypothetical protein